MYIYIYIYVDACATAGVLAAAGYGCGGAVLFDSLFPEAVVRIYNTIHIYIYI